MIFHLLVLLAVLAGSPSPDRNVEECGHANIIGGERHRPRITSRTGTIPEGYCNERNIEVAEAGCAFMREPAACRRCVRRCDAWVEPGQLIDALPGDAPPEGRCEQSFQRD